MKIFTICLLIITLTSCSSIKFKEIEMDYTQGLRGNVKEIKWKTIYYNTKYNDSVVRQQDILVVYDKNYRTLKQIVFYPKASVEEIYSYNLKGYLESIVVKYVKSTTQTQYKYDKKNNVVAYNRFTNDTLISTKLLKYDKRNNPIEKQLINTKYPENNWTEKNINDYKKRTTIVKTFDDKGKERNSYSKKTFDKNGFIIKMESFDKNHKSNSIIMFDYDAFGNLKSSTHFENGKVKSVLTAKNTYDKYGNIIVRERFSNDKLFEKTEAAITYY